MTTMQPPPERRRSPWLADVLIVVGVLFVAVLGVIAVWPSASRTSTDSDVGPIAPTSPPQAVQVQVNYPTPYPTERATREPVNPTATAVPWAYLPNCAPTLAPGSLCVPRRPQPPAPTPVSTCPAYPTWIDYCAWPDTNAGTQAEDTSNGV